MSVASINPASRELLGKFQPLMQAEADRKIEVVEEAYARRRALPAWQLAAELICAGDISRKEKMLGDD